MARRIAGFYGSFLLMLGGCMVIPLIVALVCGEARSSIAFALAMLICVIPGPVIRYISRSKLYDMTLRLRETYFIVATTWLLASFAGSLPYVFSGSVSSMVDAFFETASGFTTTGSTILADIETLPRSILLWRSITQWLGGMGIIVLFVALLPHFGIKARNIAKAETPGITVTRLTSRYTGTAQKLYLLYIGFTAAEAVLLMLGGMSFYDAVNHAMTTMATGGFSTYGDSIAHFGSAYISWVIIIFMFIAGTNFELFFIGWTSGIRKALRNEEFRLYLAIVIAATTVITVSLMTQGGYTDAGAALTDSAFQVTTVISTTGYATVDYDLWPSLCKMVLLLLMVTGASSSSTAGGVKMVRVLVFFKLIRREISKKIHGKLVKNIELDHAKLRPDTVTFLTGFIVMYILTLIIAAFLTALPGDGSMVTNFTAALTCISNVGPGFEAVGPVCTFAFYSGWSKVILSLTMIAGRLELSTLFIIVSRFFWDTSRV